MCNMNAEWITTLKGTMISSHVKSIPRSFHDITFNNQETSQGIQVSFIWKASTWFFYSFHTAEDSAVILLFQQNKCSAENGLKQHCKIYRSRLFHFSWLKSQENSNHFLKACNLPCTVNNWFSNTGVTLRKNAFFLSIFNSESIVPPCTRQHRKYSVNSRKYTEPTFFLQDLIWSCVSCLIQSLNPFHLKLQVLLLTASQFDKPACTKCLLMLMAEICFVQLFNFSISNVPL